MNQLVKGAGLVFVVLTFVGAGYVLRSGGQASAGFAVVPMVLALALMAVSRKSGEK